MPPQMQGSFPGAPPQQVQHPPVVESMIYLQRPAGQVVWPSGIPSKSLVCDVCRASLGLLGGRLRKERTKMDFTLKLVWVWCWRAAWQRLDVWALVAPG